MAERRATREAHGAGDEEDAQSASGATMKIKTGFHFDARRWHALAGIAIGFTAAHTTEWLNVAALACVSVTLALLGEAADRRQKRHFLAWLGTAAKLREQEKILAQLGVTGVYRTYDLGTARSLVEYAEQTKPAGTSTRTALLDALQSLADGDRR